MTTASFKNIITKETVIFAKSNKKNEVLKELVQCFKNNKNVPDVDIAYDDILKREKLMSTGIGQGIAIPHIKKDSIQNMNVAIAICKPSIDDYGSLDDKPVQIIIMVLANTLLQEQYIKFLATISHHFKDKSFYNQLINAEDYNEIKSIIMEL